MNQAKIEIIVATKDKAKLLLSMSDKLPLLKYIILMVNPINEIIGWNGWTTDQV